MARLARACATHFYIAIAGCGGGGSAPSTPPPDPQLVAVIADLVHGALDPSFPGRGTVDYPYSEPADIPKAYAMVVRAGSTSAGTDASLGALGSTSLDWLLSHADEDHDGIPGWGLPFPWDAFGDGSPNEANATYAISTAIVIDALIDRAGQATGERRASLIDLALQAILPYLADSAASPGGVAPYSLSTQDRPYTVFNTAAYIAAMAQRLSNQGVPPARAEELRSFADRTMQLLLESRLLAPSGAWYWPYMASSTSLNDLPHASYIAYAIQTYARHGGRWASSFPLAIIRLHLRDFVLGASGEVRAYPAFSGIESPARSYDIGFALVALCSSDDHDIADVRSALTHAIPRYRTNDGHYAKLPLTAAGPSPPVINEYETYLLYAAASCLDADARR